MLLRKSVIFCLGMPVAGVIPRFGCPRVGGSCKGTSAPAYGDIPVGESLADDTRSRSTKTFGDRYVGTSVGESSGGSGFGTGDGGEPGTAALGGEAEGEADSRRTRPIESVRGGGAIVGSGGCNSF
jgi:hypothetical protein